MGTVPEPTRVACLALRTGVWREGSAVRSPSCSHREPGLDSQHHLLLTNTSPTSRGIRHPLLTPTGTRPARGAHTFVWARLAHKNKNKSFKVCHTQLVGGRFAHSCGRINRFFLKPRVMVFENCPMCARVRTLGLQLFQEAGKL